MKTFILAAIAAASLAVASAPALAQSIDQREANQQQRINQGVASGQLTGHEAAHDQRKLSRIEARTDRMRARQGGVLTPAQHARIEQKLNHSSRRIYRTKHNDRVAG